MKRNGPMIPAQWFDSDTANHHHRNRNRRRVRNHKESRLFVSGSNYSRTSVVALLVLMQSDCLLASDTSSSSSSSRIGSTRGGHTASAMNLNLSPFESTANTAYAKPYGHIPQHRVKVSKRIIEYDNNHPYFSRQNRNSHNSQSNEHGHEHEHEHEFEEFERFERFFQNRKAEEFETYVNASSSEYLDVNIDIGNYTDSNSSSINNDDNNNNNSSNVSSVTEHEYERTNSYDDEKENDRESNPRNEISDNKEVIKKQTYEKEEDIAMWIDSQIETNDDTPYQPIRIRVALVYDQSSGYNFLSQSKRQQILNIIQPTINTWSKALSVPRIPKDKNLTIDPDQLYDGMSCGPGIESGLPSVMVPERHMDVNIGVENVDLMVYLSVGFREEYIMEYLKEEVEPTDMPSVKHSENPTLVHSVEPSLWPSIMPSDIPSIMPSKVPSDAPSEIPSDAPSGEPTVENTVKNTEVGMVFVNYTGPSDFFTGQNNNDTSIFNTTYNNITEIPTNATTNNPSSSPTVYNSASPTVYNSTSPSLSPSPSSLPTSSPSTPPTQQPTIPPKSCSGTYLASATYCSTDQFDRPIAGLLHLCIGEDFLNPSSNTMNQLTVLHELGHILGFNSHSLAHFRDKDTMEPLTERVDGGDVPDVTVECTGVKKGRGRSTIPLPSKNILNFDDKRGGVRVAQVVTPTVKQVARNRFNCPSLKGAELESAAFHFNAFMHYDGDDNHDNEDDNGSDNRNEDKIINNNPNCIGDHWERRLFKNDIMNPIIDPAISTTLISPLTLAYFIDSGWYQVDSSRAYSADTWGRGAGCEFVNKPCLERGKKVSTENSKFFCSQPHDVNTKFDGCTNDLLSKAVCEVTQFNIALPSEYQYFNLQNMGGFDADLDYCPTYVGTAEGYCKSGKDDKSRSQYRLDDFGDQNARCIPGVSKGENIHLCLQSACVVNSKKLHLKVDGNWKECKETGAMLVSDWTSNHQDYVECPDLFLACPTFHCPRDCLKNNAATSCDFYTGECKCHNPNKCNDDIVPISEYGLLKEYYVANSDELEDDERDAFDHITRMFIKMSVGEVFSFVAYSLLILVSFTIVTMYMIRVVSQRRNIITFFPRWLSKWVTNSNEWRVDKSQWSLNRQNNGNGQGNKDKMVANVLHNMRIQSNAAGIQPDFLEATGGIGDHIETQHRQVFEIDSSAVARNDETIIMNDEQIILRSQLPPLPGVGRILSIPGFTYIDDSIQIDNEDDILTTAEGTAVAHSRTSCPSSQLDSCSVQSNWDSVYDSDVLDESYIRRRRFV